MNRGEDMVIRNITVLGSLFISIYLISAQPMHSSNRQAADLANIIEVSAPVPHVITNIILEYLERSKWLSMNAWTPHVGMPHCIQDNGESVASTYYRDYATFHSTPPHCDPVNKMDTLDTQLYSKTYMLQGPEKTCIVSYNTAHGKKDVTIYQMQSPEKLKNIYTYKHIKQLTLSRSQLIAIVKNKKVLLFDSVTEYEKTISPRVTPYSIAFSPNSHYILIASYNGIIEMYHLPTRLSPQTAIERLDYINLHRKPYAIALSNSQKFAVAIKGKLRVYRDFTSLSYYSYPAHIVYMAFSPDEHILITLNTLTDMPEIRNSKTGQVQHYLGAKPSPHIYRGKNIFATGFCIDNSGSRITTIYNNGNLRLWILSRRKGVYDVKY